MSGEKLERYTGYNAKCAKCGAGLAHDHVIKSEYIVRSRLAPKGGAEQSGYIRRTCWRCGYVWKEACMDADTDTRQRDGLG